MANITAVIPSPTASLTGTAGVLLCWLLESNKVWAGTPGPGRAAEVPRSPDQARKFSA